MSLMKNLTITEENGLFTADPGGPGSPIVGRGASVLEAIGDFAVQTRLVHCQCEPPEVLSEYMVDMNYKDIKFKPPYSRS